MYHSLHVFVTFCFHSKYLGSWVSFSVHDDLKITKRLASINTVMCTLNLSYKDKHIWIYMYLKYMLFYTTTVTYCYRGGKDWLCISPSLTCYISFCNKLFADFYFMCEMRDTHTTNNKVKVSGTAGLLEMRKSAFLLLNWRIWRLVLSASRAKRLRERRAYPYSLCRVSP